MVYEQERIKLRLKDSMYIEDDGTGHLQWAASSVGVSWVVLQQHLIEIYTQAGVHKDFVPGVLRWRILDSYLNPPLRDVVPDGEGAGGAYGPFRN